MIRRSCAVAEAALHDLEAAIRPGVSENELLATFWHRMLVDPVTNDVLAALNTALPSVATTAPAAPAQQQQQPQGR